MDAHPERARRCGRQKRVESTREESEAHEDKAGILRSYHQRDAGQFLRLSLEASHLGLLVLRTWLKI